MEPENGVLSLEMRTGRLLTLVVATLLLVGVVVGVSVDQQARHRPLATTISCGMEVRHDIVVRNDLTGCTGDGLVIKASRVTIDFAGHSIASTNTTTGSGVWDDALYARPTVLDGTITGFLYGVHVNGRHPTVRGMRISGTGVSGILADPGDDAVFDRNLVYTNLESGIDARGQRPTITGNWAQDDGYHGIIVWGTGARVSRNRVSSNYSGDGISIIGGGATISGNFSDQNSSDGISAVTDHDTFSGNSANNNGGYGIEGSPGLIDLGGNTAKGNAVAQCRIVICS